MLVGQKIGPFKVDKELGSGAMGAVYLGRHVENGKKVAIKIIATGLAANSSALARFKRETAILEQANHPNIVKLIASGKVHNTPFYVMEYVEGESLDYVMERRGRITWEEVVTLGKQLCAALQHAHEKGIVHRDLKPSNLMVLRDGNVKLTDFGIAKDLDVTALTAANSTVGTAAYMSPEQCRGSTEITAKSDLYSMGVMFFELVTGRKPFLAETVMDMFMQHTKGPFPRPSRIVMELPIWLDNLICHLLEKDPEKRPYNAEKVAESLAEVQENWEKQKSAGVTAAKKRKKDKTINETGFDETDKDIARTLITGKKKKKKEEPFYTKGWFTLSAVACVLIGLGIAIFLAMKPPSGDALYDQAEKLMLSSNVADHRQAKDTFIKEFLENYSDHAKAKQVQRWADQADRELLEKQMLKRRQTMASDSESEATARLALDAEEAGKFADAVKNWQKLAPLKDSKDPDARPWGLVAGKYLYDLDETGKLERSVLEKILNEPAEKKKAIGDTKAEDLALEAMRAENQKAPNFELAKVKWEDLKDLVKKDDDRRWQILAAKRLRELKLRPAGKTP